ncbi:hypothetical protein Q4557_12015 [Shewanella sp. 5_MG-2023]|uniref:hypothetical protein n=1 Tax=Shewanella sp. 5_MG-2023 TaxID=3062656 RepID=UPI0026E18099|nr:hypothetical protein [Shewanella sp. 5_MG-2023]MDO6640682.1 hypothetical protein [Shewanella sp. 5_MG-2023]
MRTWPLASKIPFISLLVLSFAWFLFYQNDMWINDYGAAKFDWLLLIDAAIILPIICFLCIKSTKLALVKALGYFAILILLGSYIIPSEQQILWPYLTQIRYLLLTVFVLIEAFSITCVIFAIKTALKSGVDPDIAIKQPISALFGNNLVADIMIFEARVWSFFLCGHLIKPSTYHGDSQFSYHHKDGNQSNALGFIMMIMFEIPLMHLLVHFMFSAFSANVVTALTLVSLVFFIAEYRAMSRRPITIENCAASLVTDNYNPNTQAELGLADLNSGSGASIGIQNKLHIRYGVFNSFSIDLSNIKTVEPNKLAIRRAETIKRFNFSGAPNVKLTLVEPIKGIDSVYIGVDQPDALIGELTLGLVKPNC